MMRFFLMPLAAALFPLACSSSSSPAGGTGSSSGEGGGSTVCAAGYVECVPLDDGGPPVEYSPVCALVDSDPHNCGGCNQPCDVNPCDEFNMLGLQPCVHGACVPRPTCAVGGDVCCPTANGCPTDPDASTGANPSACQ